MGTCHRAEETLQAGLRPPETGPCKKEGEWVKGRETGDAALLAVRMGREGPRFRDVALWKLEKAGSRCS